MKDRHRIVLVTGGLCLGGSSTFLLNLAGEFVRREIPVLVVSLESENPYANDFKRLRIPLHIEDDRKTIFEDRARAALERIREFEPSAVVATLGPSSYEILRYIPPGVVRIGVVQSDYPEVYGPIANYAAFFDKIVGVSKEIVSNLRVHPVLRSVPAEYAPYGVTIPDVPPPRSLSVHEPIRILYFGRLCREQKRVHLFPIIRQQLREAKVPFVWTIAGDGPMREWLEQRMPSEDSAEIRFLGPVDYRTVPELLAINDIVLLASDAEGLPLSLLEAMGHGLVPVISDLRSGVSEVVDLTNGVLVSTDNVSGYAEAIVRLNENRSELAAKSAAAHARVVEKFSVQAMADRWLAIFELFSQSISWPRHFEIEAPLGDPKRWKYGAILRGFRRLTKRFLGS